MKASVDDRVIVPKEPRPHSPYVWPGLIEIFDIRKSLRFSEEP